MNETYGTRKLGADKVALLGLFIVALLTARLIVALKSALSLSEPIQLPRTGLSVSMPTSNGWRSEKQWQHQGNVFTLSSSFAPGSSRPTARAHCQYLLAAETTTPQIRFTQKAFEVDGEIAETGQAQTDTLTIDWAHINKPEVLLNTFLATAKLPDNRQLDIEVRQITDDAELTERAFKRIVRSVNFKDNQLLNAGAEMVAKIKSKGLESLLDNQNQQAFFLIKDSTRRTIGFTVDVLIDSGKNAQFNIRGAGLFYIKGRRTLEQGTSFQCSNNLNKFVYKSEIHSRAGRSGTEIILDEPGVMSVRKFDAGPEEKNYRLNPAAMPDILLDQLLRQMLGSNKKEIVVDLIEADGKITPTLVSRIELKKDAAADEDAAYVFKLELLDRRGFSEHIYFDNKKQIYKRLVQQDGVYILEGTTIEDIVREFPEWAEYILQKNKMLE